MARLDDIENRITSIEQRNKRVEIDKKWEMSWIRRGLLVFFTYCSVGLYLNAIGISDPWLNAIVPSIGFFLSTLTLPFFKRWWISMIDRKRNF